MKTARYPSKTLRCFVILLCFIGTASSIWSQTAEDDKENTVYWHIKAVLPEAKLLDIKAIDEHGKYHDVKAIQTSYDISLLSVKALVNGQTLPIKMIIKDGDPYYPVKAIDFEGRIMDVKAIGENGELLDVKGVSRMGNIIEVRAIDKEGRQFNVISVSPQEGVNFVKGLKMFNEEVEAVIHGIKIFAHVKSLKQY